MSQAWFQTIYRILLGQERGPRFGSFAALYGVAETRRLIEKGFPGRSSREHEAFLAARSGGWTGLMVTTGLAVARRRGTVLFTSFLSGIFGMAGGMILLGVLLALLDVAPAMVLFGVTQLASNGWRAWLWRASIRWPIVGGYAVGSVAMFALMKLIAFLPDKAVIFLGLGLMPFVVDRLPRALQPDITRRFAPAICGAVIMVLQLLAGAAGNVLDVFFQQSPLDRKTIVATKAATQVLAHLHAHPLLRVIREPAQRTAAALELRRNDRDRLHGNFAGRDGAASHDATRASGSGAARSSGQ